MLKPQSNLCSAVTLSGVKYEVSPNIITHYIVNTLHVSSLTKELILKGSLSRVK